MIYAGFWRRFAALVIDGLIVLLISMVLIIPYFITPLSLVISIIYKVIFETSPLRATPGKAIMGLSVVKVSGATLTVKDSLVRYVISFVSSMLMFIGYFISLFNEKRQTLHDMIAETVVIEETFAAPNYLDVFIKQWKVLFSGAAQTYGQTDANTFETTARPVNPTTSAAQSLEELYNLYQKGILTEEEYNNKKAEYLSRL